jgi:hypothetical protein
VVAARALIAVKPEAENKKACVSRLFCGTKTLPWFRSGYE